MDKDNQTKTPSTFQASSYIFIGTMGEQWVKVKGREEDRGKFDSNSYPLHKHHIAQSLTERPWLQSEAIILFEPALHEPFTTA